MYTTIRVRLKYKHLNVINRRWHVADTIPKPTNINFTTPTISHSRKTYCYTAPKT